MGRSKKIILHQFAHLKMTPLQLLICVFSAEKYGKISFKSAQSSILMYNFIVFAV